MVRQKNVRGAETLDTEVGHELTENELAAICGGSEGSTTPSGWSFGNLPNMSTILDPQGVNGGTTANKGANKTNSFPGLTGLGSLSSLTSGLLGALM